MANSNDLGAAASGVAALSICESFLWRWGISK